MVFFAQLKSCLGMLTLYRSRFLGIAETSKENNKHSASSHSFERETPVCSSGERGEERSTRHR